jgi:hypothetical protein
MKALLALAVIAALVWYLWPGLRRVARDTMARPPAPPPAPGQPPAQPRIEADDLSKCAVCGTWVPVGHGAPCERGDCPLKTPAGVG